MLIPTQKLETLGFIIDSLNMIITISQSKMENIIQIASKVLDSNSCTIRLLAKLIGKFISVFPVFPVGQLHYRILEKSKVAALSANGWDYDGQVLIDTVMKKEIQWWIQNIPEAWAPINRAPPTKFLYVDACKSGWGAVLDGIYANGHFSIAELPFSINTKETLAIYYAFLSFLDYFVDSHVLIYSDNTTAISYIKNMGGMASELRNNIACDIWNIAISRNVWISITHVPGVLNTEADFASRNLNERTEWSLHNTAFQFLCEKLGVPEIDLFASRLNHKVDKYFAWVPDPFASHVDTFTIGLQMSVLYYAFPPFSLISRFLRKVQTDQIDVLLVFPLWPTQPWFPVLLNMMCSMLIVFNHPPPIYLPWDPTRGHPLVRPDHPRTSLTLSCARVSGNTVLVRDFLDQQPYWCQEDCLKELTGLNQQRLKNGSHIVHKGRRIQILRQ